MPDVFVGYGRTLATADDKIIYRSDIPADIAGQIIKESLGIPEVVWSHVINESVALSNDPDPDMTHYRYSDFSCGCGYSYLKILINTGNPELELRLTVPFMK